MRITRESHEEYMKKYDEFKKETRERMDLIINQKRKFGILDDYGGYYPCEYIKTLDEEYGLLQVYEPSINTYHNIQVLYLFIDKFSE